MNRPTHDYTEDGFTVQEGFNLADYGWVGARIHGFISDSPFAGSRIDSIVEVYSRDGKTLKIAWKSPVRIGVWAIDGVTGRATREAFLKAVARDIGDQPKSITCPQCGKTSHNPNDVREKYCGKCRQFHEFMGLGEVGAK